jgi:anti-sigma factor ChrR (cupin superfamily)
MMKTPPPRPSVAADLGDPVLDRLATRLEPIEPPAHRADTLRDRVLAIARPATRPPNVTIPAASGDWVPIAPQVHMKVLQDSAACRTVLYRFAPGGVLPAHHHRGEEECIVLEGEAHLGDVRVQQGDYHLAFDDTDHGEVWSPTGALLFVRHSRHSAP